MNLRKANINEDLDILDFYKNVIKSIKGSDFAPQWNEKYPNLEFIKSSIEKEELYICIEDNTIISAFILNHIFDNDYSDVKWATDAKTDEITVLHTFAVNPKYSGKGYATEIFNKIKDIARQNSQKTVRIDIIDGNVGAQNVFEHLGFKYIDKIKISHYAVGLKVFHLYEYEL